MRHLTLSLLVLVLISPLLLGEETLETRFDSSEPLAERAPLQPASMSRLPLGSIKPTGWLERQLRLQAVGLTGHSEELYDALQSDSGWLGGDGDGWEKAPYYIRGLVSLGHTLGDETLIDRSTKWIDWTLESQREDGFFGPESNDDWWPRMIALRYLRDHFEATGDTRVIPFFERYFQHQLTHLPDRPLRDWGRARAGDNIDVVLWTYNQTGQKELLDLADLLRRQAYPWTQIYSDNRFYDFGDDFHPHHIVNVSQALKMPPLAWQITGDPNDRAAYSRGVQNLERQYGRADGQISGTEMLSGLSSTDGVELCADVERIVSDGTAAMILGDASAAERMETIAYNSLPAHTTADLKQLTYYQFPNQIACTHQGHGFAQDYANANMPGPHSGFPCCCYNWHIGWPKLLQHMWAATDQGGLALLAYGPNRVTALVGEKTRVTIEQATDYPFAGAISLVINPDRPVRFPLTLRTPSWCMHPEFLVNGEIVQPTHAGEQGDAGFATIDRQWSAGDEVRVRLPMNVRTSTWINDSIAVARGPLLFSLAMQSEWTVANDYADDFDEYEIRPKSPWNYALAIDQEVPKAHVEVNAVPKVPFSSANPAVRIRVPAKRLSEWGLKSQLGAILLGRADGEWNQLATESVPLAADQVHRIRITSAEGSLSVYVDDAAEPQLRFEIDLSDGGLSGLRAYDSKATFSDIEFNRRPIDLDSDLQQPFGGEWTTEEGRVTVKARPAAKRLLAGTHISDRFEMSFNLSVSQRGNAGVLLAAKNLTADLDGYQGYYVGFDGTEGQLDDSAEPPPSPVTSDEPEEIVELVPYGTTKIRVSYFPRLGEARSTQSEQSNLDD